MHCRKSWTHFARIRPFCSRLLKFCVKTNFLFTMLHTRILSHCRLVVWRDVIYIVASPAGGVLFKAKRFRSWLLMFCKKNLSVWNVEPNCRINVLYQFHYDYFHHKYLILFYFYSFYCCRCVGSHWFVIFAGVVQIAVIEKGLN